jgi:phytoene dehydrogenase-like protein
MKLRDQYDWMVLGDHPGALLSAALAARLGLSVLVLPVFPAAPIAVSQKNSRFVDPEVNFVLGLGRVSRFSGLLSECLSRLGILPAELEQIDLKHPWPQLLSPEMRLNLGLEEEALEQELARELGGKARVDASGLLPMLKRSESEFLSYWLQLPDRLTLSADRKKSHGAGVSLKDIRKKIAKDAETSTVQQSWLSEREKSSTLAIQLDRPDLVQTWAGLWYGATSSVMLDPPLSALLHLAVLTRTGASFRGGIGAYREFLLRLAQRLGAHVPPKTEIKRIFVDQGRFTGVQIASRGNLIAGNGAVVGCSLAQVSGLVNLGGRNWFKKLKASPVPVGWRFTLAFTVAAGAIPPGATSRMVWNEAEAPVLEIEIVDPADYGIRKPDRRVIFARTVLPYTELSLSIEYQRMISARMMRQLTDLFPFVEEHVTDIYPEFREPGALQELREVYPYTRLEEIPENLRCLPCDRAVGAGVGAHSGIEGFFVATSESFPELGSLGPTVAALESVSWLAHRAGLAGPFV